MSRKGLKVAQVCDMYFPSIGGVQTHVKEISERLVRMGFDIEVLTTDPLGGLKKRQVIKGVRIQRFRSLAPSASYYFSLGLTKYLAKNRRYDIVHTHNYQSLPSFFAAMTKGSNRLIFTPRYHGGGGTFLRNMLHRPYELLGRRIFAAADIVVCLSDNERRLVLSRFPMARNKVVVIPNGVTKSEFHYSKRKHDDSTIRMLCVARLEKYKGIQYVIEAIPRMRSAAFLDIVGDGPYKRNLVELARRMNLMDQVKFHANVEREKLLQIYADANIFFLLSKYEAFGNAVAEALSSKTRCIVPDIPSLRHWIDNKNCFGVSYPIKLDELVQMIEAIAGREAENAKLLDWDEVARRLAEVYCA